MNALRWPLKRLLLRVFGRPVVCIACGKAMFDGIALVRGGKVRVLGADARMVRVAFDTEDTLHFAHAQRGECRPV